MTNPCYNPNCPACIARKAHEPIEWEQYHPLRTHGFSPETGWTHPEAKAAHEKEVEAEKRRVEAAKAAKSA